MLQALHSNSFSSSFGEHKKLLYIKIARGTTERKRELKGIHGENTGFTLRDYAKSYTKGLSKGLPK